MTVQSLKLEEAIRNQEKYIKMMMKIDEKTLRRNIEITVLPSHL